MVDPASTWVVYVDSLTVSATEYTGAEWDTGSPPGSLPDPYVGVSLDGSGYRYTSEPLATNTLSAVNAGPAVLTDVRAFLLASLFFDAWDDDGFGDDRIGTCAGTVAAAAFSGVTQVTDCPRVPGASESGFTVRWHLERF